MPQSKLIDVKFGEYGTVVTFENFDGQKQSFMYNGKLTVDQLEKLRGTDISYEQPMGTQLDNIYKAWNPEGKIVFSTIPFDGDDRGNTANGKNNR